MTLWLVSVVASPRINSISGRRRNRASGRYADCSRHWPSRWNAMKSPFSSTSLVGSNLSMASTSSGATLVRSAVAARIASVGRPSPEPNWSRICMGRSRSCIQMSDRSLQLPIIAHLKYRQQTTRQVRLPVFRVRPCLPRTNFDAGIFERIRLRRSAPRQQDCDQDDEARRHHLPEHQRVALIERLPLDGGGLRPHRAIFKFVGEFDDVAEALGGIEVKRLADDSIEPCRQIG